MPSEPLNISLPDLDPVHPEPDPPLLPQPDTETQDDEEPAPL
jgi:hypothetical protein